MAGAAKTKNFLLSTATVMVGKPEDLHKLNPAEHALGLVKNFQMTADPTYVELTQGVKNSVVMSVKNADGVKCSMEIYEYTVRNLGYAAGLDASGVAFDQNEDIWLASAAYASAGKTIEVNSDISSKLAAGDFIFMQNGIDDKVHIAKVASAVFATSKTTITIAAGYEPATAVVFPVGSRLGRVKRIDVGNTDVQPEFSAKIVGLLPKDNAPFTILLPKIKITKGMGVAFQTDNFGNLPFEFTPYSGVSTDPFFTEYANACAILFAR
ncbi:hypothetical protein [Rhizobium sp. Leaf383]|uniref:hypothetical protein n=1 Tax=Rhizobium sp. Leaf383 TaxID=1736357 RepID=UPI000715D774|nr:hypothetical protein [Rhizobium sp. Leaf383]KQS84253.1 hypothetical protein ASG58_21015 [Rhizobium sp. Leaf383]